MSRQRVLCAVSLLSKGFRGPVRNLPVSSPSFVSTSLQLSSPKQIFMFSTSQMSRKIVPNSEPHINNAKARPAEQGLRLDENPNDVGPRNSSTNSTNDSGEQDPKLTEELNRVTSENVKLVAKAKEFEASCNFIGYFFCLLKILINSKLIFTG